MSRSGLPVSVFIAEDDPLLRKFLKASLADHAGFAVVGDSGDGSVTLEEVARLQPQVLLLDLSLPGLSGLEVLERLSASAHAPRVLVLSGNETEEMQLKAARNGAKGFLCKSQAGPALAEAIHTVAEGGVWLASRVVEHIVSEYPTLARRAREQERPINQLTEKERAVLVGVARGMTNAQIASELYMSFGTVKCHLRNILRKLNLPNRARAAAFAVSEGLLESAAEGSYHTTGAPV